MRPTLSMPAPFMISMARATSIKRTSLSPLTNATFSARSLKICSIRGPRVSQVVSSLLILSFPFCSTWTTTVLFSSSWFCCWLGEGCGTSASSPLGVSGVMTMKMIMSTNRMSINGTTFGDAIEPLELPTSIPIANSPIEPHVRFCGSGPRRVGSGAVPQTQQTNDPCGKAKSTASVARFGFILRLLRAGRFDFFRQQTEGVDARGTNLVHGRDHVPILRSRITFHVHGLVQLVGDAVFDLPGDVFFGDLGITQVQRSITGHGDNNGIVLIRVLHFPRIRYRGHVHRHTLLQHGRDHHEDDQQHQHDVGHGNYVRGRHLRAGLWLIGHS